MVPNNVNQHFPSQEISNTQNQEKLKIKKVKLKRLEMRKTQRLSKNSKQIRN